MAIKMFIKLNNSEIKEVKNWKVITKFDGEDEFGLPQEIMTIEGETDGWSWDECEEVNV